MIHDLSTKEAQKPNTEDFDLQPYGYIHALQIYVEFLESKIYTKENKTEENIYLNRLREQYKKYKELKSWSEESRYELQVYSNIKCFCLDTQLVSFNDVEVMENEINSSF